MSPNPAGFEELGAEGIGLGAVASAVEVGSGVQLASELEQIRVPLAQLGQGQQQHGAEQQHHGCDSPDDGVLVGQRGALSLDLLRVVHENRGRVAGVVHS